MKFFLKTLFFSLGLFVPSFVWAAAAAPGYVPLTPLNKPNGDSLYKGDSIPDYLNNIFSFGIAICGALAVIMIVFAGIKYMLSDAFTSKEQAKEQIRAALIGLGLALASYLILFTINPDLINIRFNAPSSSVPNATNELAPTNLTLGGSNTSIGGGTGGGSIATQALMGASFPTKSGLTDEQVERMIMDAHLLDLSPSDAATYFAGGVPTVEGYRSLLAAIANSESGFNPNSNINHSQGTDVGNTYSEGLFSLTPTDGAVRSLNGGVVPPDSKLADPVFNAQAAINILKNQIQKEGSIAGKAGGDHHYFGPLYNGK